MKLFAIPALMLAVLVSMPAQAKLKVFACEPEWGSLVHELAGDKVDVDVGTSALQDVHVIEAKPSLIAKVRSADLLVCTGAELDSHHWRLISHGYECPGLPVGNRELRSRRR